MRVQRRRVDSAAMSEELIADFDMQLLSRLGPGVRCSLYARPAPGIFRHPCSSGRREAARRRCSAAWRVWRHRRRGAFASAPRSGSMLAAGFLSRRSDGEVGYLSQDYALFPQLNVADNIGFGLGHLRRAERKRAVHDVLDRFGLHELHLRFPRQLSGGQQQRVALARPSSAGPDCCCSTNRCRLSIRPPATNCGAASPPAACRGRHSGFSRDP